MDFDIECQECKKKVPVQKMVIDSNGMSVIPDCGHIHEVKARAVLFESGNWLVAEYTGFQAERIPGTNNWRSVEYRGHPIPKEAIKPDGTLDMIALEALTRG